MIYLLDLERAGRLRVRAVDPAEAVRIAGDLHPGDRVIEVRLESTE